MIFVFVKNIRIHNQYFLVVLTLRLKSYLSCRSFHVKGDNNLSSLYTSSSQVPYLVEMCRCIC